MKKNILKIIIFSIMFLMIDVTAATVNDGVGTDLTISSCSTEYQDNNFSISNSAYFSHCMRAKCNNNKYNVVYYTNSMPQCSNGNSNYYYKIYKNGCSNYEQPNISCTNNTEKYCSIIMFYDCTKKLDGSNFYTTTTTTKKKVTTSKTAPITKPTVTETITTAPVVDTSLSSLSLSNGTIEFNKDVFEYSISVDSSVTSIDVNAVPSDITSKVDIVGNTNILNGSVITINVVGTDGSITKYTINVLVENVVNSNSKLKSLNIEGYEINFDPSIFDYNIIIKEGINELNIDYEADSSLSTVLISNNNDLKNGSIINILVTAQDGSNSEYKININVKKKSNILGVLFLIVIIFAILFGVYYIFKMLKASKIGEKYEYE